MRYIKENNIDTLAWGHKDIAYEVMLKKKNVFFLMQIYYILFFRNKNFKNK